MENTKIENAIEALLYISGESVESETLIAALDININDFERIMNSFVDKYNLSDRGLKIIKFGNCYQLATRPEYVDYVKKFAGVKKPNNLSNAAMEVLAIIAYNQPVTRSTIDKIRGVDSFGPLEKLLARDIVEEKGRLEAPGRPILYGTTKEFLRTFGLKSIDEMPDITSVQMSMEQLDEISEGEE